MAAIQKIDESMLLWIQNSSTAGILNPAVELFSVLGNAGMIWILILFHQGILALLFLLVLFGRKCCLVAGCEGSL